LLKPSNFPKPEFRIHKTENTLASKERKQSQKNVANKPCKQETQAERKIIE